MQELTSNSETRLGSDRNFGIVFGIVFSLVATYLLVTGYPIGWVALFIAFGFFAVAYWRPVVLHRANRLWFKFGLLLHSIISPIVMFLVFVLAFVPTGLFVKLRGNDPLSRDFDPELQSYWKPRDKPPESMKRQY